MPAVARLWRDCGGITYVVSIWLFEMGEAK